MTTETQYLAEKQDKTSAEVVRYLALRMAAESQEAK